MPVSANETQLFTSNPMIIYIGQIWADILEFGGHIGFHSTWNLYIWFLCIHHNTLGHEYQLCSSKTKRYSYTLPTAILSFGRHLGFRLSYNLCPEFFWIYVYCQHILIISGWYQESKYKFSEKNLWLFILVNFGQTFWNFAAILISFSLSIHIFEFSVRTAYILR